MLAPGITSQSEGRVMISDDFLDTHKSENGNGIDCYLLTPADAFVQPKVPKRGIGGIFLSRMVSINGAVSGSGIDYNADYAVINGKEPDDPDHMQQYFTLHQLHAQRFRFIYPKHTTARGIILHQ